MLSFGAALAAGGLFLGAALPGAGLGTAWAAGASDAKHAAAANLYRLTNVWTIHLRFTADQWEAMEPKGGNRSPFGGPGMFLAPAFLGAADADKSGQVSAAEFRALSEKWFAAWDKEKKGKLGPDQLRDGLNAAIAPPGGGPPGGGGPGGGQRGGGGMNLQGPEGKRNGLSSATGTEFNYVHANLEFDGKTYENVAVRYKGNGTFMQSRGSLKRSLKIDLNEFVKGQKIAGLATLNLHNSITDASWMNEVLAHRLYRDAGVPAPRSAYAKVYVTVPGKHDKQYFGLYSLVENPDHNLVEEAYHTKKGAIFKPVTMRPFEDLGSDWSKYQQAYDPKTPPTPAQKQRVIDFCKLVSQADDTAFAAKLGDYLDIDEFARFMAVTTWLSTLDSILGMGQNFVVYLHPKTEKFQFLPWDLDHAFGQFPMIGTQEQREQLSINKPWHRDVLFLQRVFKVEAFKKQYLARMEEFNRSIFKPERFQKQVDDIAAAIRPAVKEESEEKLARFDKVTAGEAVEPAGFGGDGRPGGGPGGGGQRFGPPGGFGQVKPIKAFAPARSKSITEQLEGKSEGLTITGGFGGGPGGGGPGPGGPGGPNGGPGGRGGGPGGPGGPPGGFGPGNFLSGLFVSAMDTDKDGSLSKDEFLGGFTKWFAAWNTDKSGQLTEDQLLEGINKDLSPFRGGGPMGGPGGGPPPPR